MAVPFNIVNPQLLFGYISPPNPNIFNDIIAQQSLSMGDMSTYTEVNLDGDDCNEVDDEDDEEKRTLFCGNLDEHVTEEILYEVFLQAGPIETVNIPKDRDGRPRTFGFVTYVHRCSPTYAIQLLQGLTLFRKTVTIRLREGSKPSPQKRFVPMPDTDECKKRRSNEQNQAKCITNRSTPSKESATDVRNEALDWSLGSSRYRNRNSNQGEYWNNSITGNSKSVDKYHSENALDRTRDYRQDRSHNYDESDRRNNQQYHRSNRHFSQRHSRRS